MDGVCKIVEGLAEAVARAQGFAEGIEAALNWHRAKYTTLVIMADADRREGRYSDATELLNRAIEHARSVPAIRALAPPAQFGFQSDE
jgi:hypothetical protein